MDWICGFLTGCIAGCIFGLVLAPCRKETTVVVTTSAPRRGGALRMDWSRCEFPGPPDRWNPVDHPLEAESEALDLVGGDAE